MVNGGSDKRSVWGIHIPCIHIPYKQLEPVGATNRVSQPSKCVKPMEISDSFVHSGGDLHLPDLHVVEPREDGWQRHGHRGAKKRWTPLAVSRNEQNWGLLIR